MIRVLIANDHAILREGVRLILSPVPDMRVETMSTRELGSCRTPLTGLWNVLLLDLTIPGDNNGFDRLKRLRQRCSTLPILVISVHPEEQCGVYALKAGAAGYLNTSSSPGELVKAIRKVAAGGRYISPTLAELLAQRLDGHGEQAPEELLSVREFDVFLRLATGERPTSIAHSLQLSIKTISTYRSRILEKLQLQSNCQLVHYAIQRDLILSVGLQEVDGHGSPLRRAVV